ncbi:MAG: hypothetical protein JJV93_00530 [Alphaproteobacteria bacterium]|nr:hypothetical protein [Alphaproteobacteria bacterium]MBL0717739.1 hypothetical protein [Alphaproteobacteria bacterium]
MSVQEMMEQFAPTVKKIGISALIVLNCGIVAGCDILENDSNTINSKPIDNNTGNDNDNGSTMSEADVDRIYDDFYFNSGAGLMEGWIVKKFNNEWYSGKDNPWNRYRTVLELLEFSSPGKIITSSYTNKLLIPSYRHYKNMSEYQLLTLEEKKEYFYDLISAMIKTGHGHLYNIIPDLLISEFLKKGLVSTVINSPEGNTTLTEAEEASLAKHITNWMTLPEDLPIGDRNEESGILKEAIRQAIRDTNDPNLSFVWFKSMNCSSDLLKDTEPCNRYGGIMSRYRDFTYSQLYNELKDLKFDDHPGLGIVNKIILDIIENDIGYKRSIQIDNRVSQALFMKICSIIPKIDDPNLSDNDFEGMIDVLSALGNENFTDIAGPQRDLHKTEAMMEANPELSKFWKEMDIEEFYNSTKAKTRSLSQTSYKENTNEEFSNERN